MNAYNARFSPDNPAVFAARRNLLAINRFFTVQAGCIICSMDEELIRKVRSELARQGGLARAKALTSKQRKESATKASKAAAKARSLEAKERKATQSEKSSR